MSNELIPAHSVHAQSNGVSARRHSVTTVTPDESGTVFCDVLVIGSGMGGSTFAQALGKKGHSVLVVERGDFLPHELENWDAQEVFGKGRYRNAESWLDSNNRLFRPGVFYYVGGNTKFYGAMLPRFREVDFKEIKHHEGVAPAWPVSYAEFEPFYCEAERLYQVHGASGQDPSDPWRSQPYPWPGLIHDPALQGLEQSMRAQGLKPFSMPAAVDYGTNRECVLCPTCDGYPCLLGAKADAEMATLRPALAGGNVRLMVGTKIERLNTAADGQRVTEAIGTRNGQAVQIQANRIVLACGAVNSAALLLRSKSALHPNGLGNSSDQVGRNYMVHNSTFMIAVNPWKVNRVRFQKSLAINDWYSASSQNLFPLGNVQMLGKIREPMITPMRPWIPKFVSRFITSHSVDLYLTSEDIPTAENRVTYDEQHDTIKVHWKPNNLKAHEALVEKTTQLMKRAGYPIILAERMGIATNSHQCGTAVMGMDPKTSALDINCKMHDLDNVWVVDSSFFPSSAAVNPALTIAANALRVASKF